MVFVGDSTTRQLFWAAARKLDFNWVADRRAEQEPLGDLELDVEGARLRFIWDPWLNSTALKQELKTYMERNSLSKRDQIPSPGKRRQALLLMGGGLWHARHLQDDYLASYKLAVDQAAAAMGAARSSLDMQNRETGGEDGVGDQLFFAPVFEPLYDQLSPSRRATITPDKIQAMNQHLQFQSQHGLNVPWVFQNMTAGYPEVVGTSGMHVTNSVAERMTDVVLNYRCNAKLAHTEGFPYSQTCCSAYRPFNLVTAIAAISCAFLLGLAMLKRFSPNTVKRFAQPTMLDVLATLALVIGYCFIADRTHIMDKFPKEFDNIDFRVMLGVGIGACLFDVRSIASSPASSGRAPDGPAKSVRRAKFLPREQSDEFKGWMQIYMLVYGYTAASSEIDFYKVFRIFFALYLFLSGYGHTKYFLRRKDYSLQRVFSVLLRLNTLPVLLSFTMGRPYTSYFFAPLVSFWFLVVYATLRIGYQWNGLGWVLAGKIGVSALLVTGFVYLKGLLEGCTAIFSLVFGTEMDAGEWRFYLSNDRWVVFVGMLVAAMKTQTLWRPGAPRPNKWLLILWRSVVPGLALLAIPVFWIPMGRLRTQDDYNWWFGYTGWLPVLFFVALRNATPFLRNHYSNSFAKLGRISLELYLIAQHTWLAGDGKGLLRAGFPEGDGSLLKDRWRDVCVLSVVLVWLAWEAHSATQATTAWVLGTEQAAVGRGGVQNQQEGLELPVWDGAGPQRDEGPRGEGVVVAGLRLPGVGLRLVGVGAAVWVASLLNR
jgi:hypothetical protein